VSGKITPAQLKAAFVKALRKVESTRK